MQPTGPGGREGPRCQLSAASWGLAEAGLAIGSLCLWGLLFWDPASGAVGKASRTVLTPALPPHSADPCHQGPAKCQWVTGEKLKHPILISTLGGQFPPPHFPGEKQRHSEVR